MGVSPIRQSKDCLFLLSKVFWFVKYKTCLIEVYRCYKLASEGWWNKFHLSTTILYYHFITSIFEIYWLFCVISLKRFFTFQNISFISGRDLWQYESMRFDYKWILPSNTARDTLLGMLESFCSNSNNIILSLWFLKTIDFFV